MALAERMAHARWPDLTDHWTYVIAGDGCLMEAISQEAIDLAGHLRLGRLTVPWDDNRITIDGRTDLSTSADRKVRFAAARWHMQAVDRHDREAVAAAIQAAWADDRRSMVACKTIIDFGAPNKRGGHDAHGAPLGPKTSPPARCGIGRTTLLSS